MCYRREDSSGHAGRLHENLCARFDSDDVFMDLDKIKPGEDFLEVVKQSIGSCTTLLVLIGRHWLAATDESGRRRLDTPKDTVRLEIEAGLAGGLKVIPILLQGAVMPRENQLPASLSNLAVRAAIELSDSRWDYDAGRLIQAIAGPGVLDVVKSPSLSPSIVSFLERLEDATSKLQLIGLGHGVQLELPIQQAYIPLNVIVARDLWHDHPGRFDERFLHRGEHVEENVDLSEIFKWAARFDHRGVILLGDPGAGKTTGARQFCWRLLKERDSREILGLPQGTLPVFLRLRYLSREHLARDLKTFIIDSVAARALPDDLANPGPELLARRGVVWVFDGLDEVVNEDARVKVSHWIAQALADRPNDYFLVTSRYQGYQGKVDLGPAFCQFHVKPLNSQQGTDFVDHWYRTVYRKLHGPGEATEEKAAAAIRSLTELLQQPEYRIGHLRELPANPLMLTVLCLVHHQDRNLPRRRADLYAKCVRVPLEHWRQEMREIQGLPDFDPEAAEGVLSVVAWWLHTKENRTTHTVEDLGAVAGRALADLAPGAGLGRDGAEFIRRMRDECGILAMWGSGQCGFLHLRFQEYLAGFHAAREGLADQLVERMESSWWREVILIALALGSKSFSHDFFAALLKTDAMANQGAFVDQCLDEVRYVAFEPFIEALRERDAVPERQVDILRRLRQFDHPELVAVCQELAVAAVSDLSALAREVLHRAGVEVERPALEVVGDGLELRVDSRTGIAFVAIPAGEFEMGDENKKSAHRVRISSPFLLGRYAVTNQEYQRFLEAKPGIRPSDYWNNSRFNDPKQPVVGVSWEDTRAFCEWAGCRLPTEAEWEYACRAGTTTVFHYGDSLSSKQANFNGNSPYPRDKAEKGPYLEKTTPVGSYEPNRFGLYDMHGNVWEWCQDCYGEYPKGPVSDPTGPSEGEIRVLRGGGWHYLGEICRSAPRNWYLPSLRDDFIGFRVVLSPRSVP